MLDTLLYRICAPIVGVYIRLVYKPEIINKEIIPKEGKIIIAGTHTNMKDCCLLAGCCTRRDIRFVAKRELLKPPFGFLFRMSGIIPVNRKIHDATVMPAVNKVLSEGGMVGIFPEGTINRTDDIIMPFKKGAVRMSLENNCKILPFAINGKYKRGKLKIKFGNAYFPETKDIEKETKLLEQKVIKLIKECE